MAGRWLADGRIAVIGSSAPAPARLRFFDGRGEETTALDLPGPIGSRVAWGGQAGDIVAIGLEKWQDIRERRKGEDDSKYSTVLVDVAAGRVLRQEVDLTPAWSWPWWEGGSEAAEATRGVRSLAVSLLAGSKGGLFLVDPQTGDRRVVIPPPS